MCVCLFFFTRWPACWAYACSGSLPLDLCILVVLHCISIHVVANKVLSLCSVINGTINLHPGPFRGIFNLSSLTDILPQTYPCTSGYPAIRTSIEMFQKLSEADTLLLISKVWGACLSPAAEPAGRRRAEIDRLRFGFDKRARCQDDGDCCCYCCI